MAEPYTTCQEHDACVYVAPDRHIPVPPQYLDRPWAKRSRKAARRQRRARRWFKPHTWFRRSK